MPPENTSQLLADISRIYYEVIPLKYSTYCVLTSQVTQDVLRYFDVASCLIPCQLWCATDKNNYVIGFFGADPLPQKWDGHIVCGTDEYIIDAAVSHFSQEFAIQTPKIIVTKRFRIPSHTIARVDLVEDRHLWWQDAPTVADRYPSLEDMKLVKSLAHQIVSRMESSH